MSYEDLSEAQVKRAAKDKASESKRKRGRKRKSPAPEQKTEVARMSEVLEPWRAPLARMAVKIGLPHKGRKSFALSFSAGSC